MRKRQTSISLLRASILILIFTITTPAYAASNSTVSNSVDVPKPSDEPNFSDESEYHRIVSDYNSRGSIAPNNKSIATLEDLVKWCNSSSNTDRWAELTEEIIVNRSITLNKSAGSKDLGAINHGIRVTNGGRLTLNQPKLNITSIKEPTIIVESGGELVLLRGAIWPAQDTISIVVEKGGKVTIASSFSLNGGLILDRNETELIPGDKPNPPDLTVPVLPSIINTIGFDDSLSCIIGDPPDLSEYPATKRVICEESENQSIEKNLPVQWELDNVDFEKAGTYTVKGTFTADVLAANGLRNPNGVSPTLQLTVLKPSPIDTLRGDIMWVESDGNCLVRLAMPLLPEDATALYIHRSVDGEHWQKAVQDVYMDGNIPITYYDFLPSSTTTPNKLYVPYYYQTDYQSIWLQVEVVGSAVAGISNKIKLEMPSSAKPGENVNTGLGGNDGSSGGNRGGGGQREGDRGITRFPDNSKTGNNPLFTNQTWPDDEVTSPAMSKQSPDILVIGGEAAFDIVALNGLSRSELSMVSPVDTELKAPEAASASTALPREEQELITSAGTNNRQPQQKSRGVMTTAGATVLVAGGLLLIRKTYNNRKRKP